MGRDPHDALFKFAFSKVEHAIGELRSVLPPALVEQLDFSTLSVCDGSLVDSQLSKRYSDVLYSVSLGGRPAFLYVLLEHQSTVDSRMPFRLLKYMVRIWDDWVVANPEAVALPVIVPVVVHHSPTGWTAPVGFEDMFDLSDELRRSLGDHIPRLRFVLDDVSRLGDEALRSRAMTAFGRVVLVSLRDSRNGDELLRRLAAWADLIREVARSPGGRDALAAFARYIHEVLEVSVVDVEATIVAAVGEEVREPMATVADRLREEGRLIGELESHRSLVRRQLTGRFGALPEAVRSRLDSASLGELEQWADRVLVAKTLAEVFGDA